MDFKQALEDGCYRTHLAGESKASIIEEMVDLLADAGKIPDRRRALAALAGQEG